MVIFLMMWLQWVRHGTIHKKMSSVSRDHCICLHFRYNLVEPTTNAIVAANAASDTSRSAAGNYCDDNGGGGYACLNTRHRRGSAAWDSCRPIGVVLSQPWSLLWEMLSDVFYVSAQDLTIIGGVGNHDGPLFGSLMRLHVWKISS